jgi:hypothetical protein
MQGHPESPRLWEKHADAILQVQDIGHTPYTTMSLLWPHQQHTCCSHETSQ